MRTIYTVVIAVVIIVALLVGGFAVATNLGQTSSRVSTTSTTTNTSSSSTTSLISTSSSTSSSSSSNTSSSSSSSNTSSTSSSAASSSSTIVGNTTKCCSISTVRIGYFANINHAQFLVGLFDGSYNKSLGGNATIHTYLFNSGTTEITALLAGQLDMAYIGPSPAVTGYLQSNGTALQIVAGAANGGAELIVNNNSNIHTAADFQGKIVAAPGKGNTQDVSLRTWLLSNHLVDGTNVTVQDTSNSQIVSLMATNKIDAAWVPEPWATTLVDKAHAHVFLDERSLWPGGNFSTAELVATKAFLSAHYDVVYRILEAHVNETMWINAHYSQATTDLNSEISTVTGGTGTINSTILAVAMTHLNFTYSPLEASVQNQTDNAFKLGFVTSENITGLFNLNLLNQVLKNDGLPPVNS